MTETITETIKETIKGKRQETAQETSSEQSVWAKWGRVERPASALILLRLIFFTLLTYDLWWIALSHAPRYGAGGFNVPHLGLLAGWLPSATSIGALYLVGGLLSALAALGIGGRLTVAVLAVGYNLAYLWSQADSYQHHYLLGLLLALFSWAPLTALSSQAISSQAQEERSRSKGWVNLWLHPGYDLIFVQMALIYFWTAVAKTEPVWLSGETLDGIIRNPEVRATVLSWGSWAGLNAPETMKALSWGVMIGEYLAPIAYLIKPLRLFGFLMIPWFHISVEWVGFDIELFSYYMIALNLCLLSPAALWRPFEALRRGGELLLSLSSLTRLGLGHTSPSVVAGALWVGSIYLCAVSVARLPVEGAFEASLLGAGLMLPLTLWHVRACHIATRPASWMTPFVFALSVILSIAALRSSELGFDYYRMWGGDLKRRGELSEAAERYQRANELKRSGVARHAALGAVLLQLGRAQEASQAYEESAARWSALALEEQAQGRLSSRAERGLKRAYQGWARALMSVGEREAARAVLEQLNLTLTQLKGPSP
jgi:tetratricopeptide (TPR) repeat protein